jgi:glycosyltransferase involved in cell wall biosynthesis
LGKDPESSLLQGAEDFTARARAAFTEALGQDKEDVTALCHEWPCVGVLTELRAQGVPAILSLHSLESQRSDLSGETSRSIQEVERLGLEAAASVLVHSAGAAEAACKLLPACAERLVHLRRPFPVAEFDGQLDPGAVKARFQIGPIDPTVLFVGDLDERHGPDIIMKSIPAVLKNHPQARFVFVGDGSLLWPLRVYSRYLLLDHVVRMVGHLEGQPLRELIKAADIVAVPSRERTEEWQILAAWAAERAVVATHNVGAALLEHERDGVLVYPHESSLVWGLERLLYDHALRQAAASNGNRKLLARYGQASAARQIEELMGVVS